MKPLFPNVKPFTDEERLTFLSKQIEAGKQLAASPALVEYIELQVEMLLQEATSLVSGSPEYIKDTLLLKNIQIAAYKHLHELAVNNSDLLKQYASYRETIQNEV